MAQSQPPSQLARSLLELPDKALLTVLRCLAEDDDLPSLFSAARTCSELQQLSAAALTSIDTAATQQQQVASPQLYLARHGQHVSSLQLRGYYSSYSMLGDSDSDGLDGVGYSDFRHAGYPMLDELPTGLLLDRLSLTDLRLQLLPGGGRAGVLQSGAPIKQLEISNCAWRDSAPDAAFAQALSQLPQLEHITYSHLGEAKCFPGHVLSDLQQLTSLDVSAAPCRGVLEFVHLAPRLRDLKARLNLYSRTANKLPVGRHLTSLELSEPYGDNVEFSTAGLAQMSHLQHQQLRGATVAGGPAGVSVLLSELQQMTQLTHLTLPGCWDLGADDDPSGPPAAAYAALTASSTLEHVDVSGNTMPQGAWQQVLPADRQLPQLRLLYYASATRQEVGHMLTLSGWPAAAPTCKSCS